MLIKVDIAIMAKAYAYISLCEVPPGQEKMQKEILDYIEEKSLALQKRQLFQSYKTAPPGSAEREDSRQKYLDAIGTRSSFRSSKELH